MQSEINQPNQLDPKFFIWYILFVLVLLPIQAIVFVHLRLWMSSIVIDLTITTLYGIMLGGGIDFIAKKTNMKNKLLLVLLVLVAAVLWKYTQFAVYVPAIHVELEVAGAAQNFGEQLSDAVYLFFRPWLLFIDVSYINEHGVWALSENGDIINGTMLTLIWFSEFAITTGAAIIMAAGSDKMKKVIWQRSGDEGTSDEPAIGTNLPNEAIDKSDTSPMDDIEVSENNDIG